MRAIPITVGLLSVGVLVLCCLRVHPGDAAGAAAAPNLARGKAMFEKTCVPCHGEKAQGKREIQSPALHMQEPWYIAEQLLKFRTGLRGTAAKDATGMLMRPMALSIPDEQQVHEVANYIATLSAPPSPHEVVGDAVVGAATFTRVCAACHGANARGKLEIKSPSLVGQSDWYLVMQLEKFKAGLRGADAKDITGMQMRAMALTLPDDKSVKDVVSYIASLK